MAYKGQSQDQMKELQSALLKAEEELKELRLELDDEKKKVEDLQFKIEEDEVMNESCNNKETEEFQQKIKTLEEKLQKSEVNFTVNQTELNSKIKNLEDDLE